MKNEMWQSYVTNAMGHMQFEKCDKCNLTNAMWQMQCDNAFWQIFCDNYDVTNEMWQRKFEKYKVTNTM